MAGLDQEIKLVSLFCPTHWEVTVSSSFIEEMFYQKSSFGSNSANSKLYIAPCEVWITSAVLKYMFQAFLAAMGLFYIHQEMHGGL